MSNEREISIVDLLWRILFGWRLVLAFAVICTILGGLVSYNKYNSAKAAASNADAEIVLKAEEMEAVVYAVGLTEAAKAAEDYCANSYLMQVDPCNIDEEVFSFYIEAQEWNIDAITEMYRMKLLSDEFASKVAQAIGVEDSEYVSELLSLTGKYGNEKNAISELVIKQEHRMADTVTLYILSPNGDNYDKLDRAVRDYIMQVSVDSEKIVGEHAVRVVAGEHRNVTDRNLAAKQITELNNLNTVKVAADNALKALTGQQMSYYNNLDADPSKEPAEVAAPHFSKKYVLLGFVLGVFLACAWIACKAIFASKLQNREELESQYHLRMLGAYESPRVFKGLDKLFNRWRHCNEKALAAEERTDIICSNIAILCEKSEHKSVSVTGTCVCEANRQLFDRIAAELKKRGIDAEVEENIIYNTSALKDVTKSGAAVIVEQVDVSRYREIEQELITLKGNDIAVIGCVGIE